MNRKTLLALIAALLVTVLVFAGCVSEENPTEPSTEPSTEEVTTAPPTTEPPTTEPPTDPPTEPPTEPPIIHPLTGEVLDAPLENRIVAVTINNVSPALPHMGVNEADLYFEMFVNDRATRGLALYTNIGELKQVGSVRSLRTNFTEIAVGYDAIVCHAGGSDYVINHARNAGVARIDVNTDVTTSCAFRDRQRYSSGYKWEHCLFVNGTGIYAKAESKGLRTAMDQEKDFGLTFSEEGSAVSGEDASTVTVIFNHKGSKKDSTFTYDAESGKYLFSQYGKNMKDGTTGDREAFKNVIVILTTVKDKTAGNATYHVATLEGSGSGYFACGGKIVPITWSRSGPYAPFTFTMADGTPVELGVGNSYIGICPTASTVSWE